MPRRCGSWPGCWRTSRSPWTGTSRPGNGPGKASDGEQTLLKRLAEQRPEVFRHRVTCFDRNFPGYDLITAVLLAGGHVIARVKEGIALPSPDTPDRGWLPGRSRVSWLNAP